MWSKLYNVLTSMEFKWKTQGVIEKFSIIKWHNRHVLAAIYKLHKIELLLL